MAVGDVYKECDSTYVSSTNTTGIWCGATLYPGQYSTISVGVSGTPPIEHKPEMNKKLLLLEGDI